MNNAEYCARQIIDHLVGGIIIGVVTKPPDKNNGEFFGFRVRTKEGEEKVAWIQADAEGNAPGWIAIEPWK